MNTSTTYATGKNVTLDTNWEGELSGESVKSGDYTSHLIVPYHTGTVIPPIPANRIIAVSVCASDVSAVNIRLFNSTGGEITKASGGDQTKVAKVRFFRVTASSNYTIRVYGAKGALNNYTVKVAVVNLVQPFVPADCMGIADSSTPTFMISSDPEYLTGTGCKGEYGYYVARGKLGGRARLYWEHYNQYNTNMMYGVMLWNKDTSKALKVRLVSRSVKSSQSGSDIFGASTGVWVDCFNDVKQSDQSDLGTTTTLDIPAYSAGNPGASARWVALQSVPGGSTGLTGFFNGMLSLEIKDASGNLYNGANLFCDTYMVTPGYQDKIKPAIANMAPAAGRLPTNTRLQRGSGAGAVLAATIPGTTTISPGNPFKILMTGIEIPELQTGESMILRHYSKTGAQIEAVPGNNYGVLYRFVFSNLQSNSTIKGKITINVKTNAGIATADGHGIYVAGYITGKKPFAAVVKNRAASTNTYTFQTAMPTGQVVLNILVSGMSTLPLEINLSN